MTTLTETFHDGGFMVSEANKTRSREAITIASGQTLTAGMVLGKVTATGYYKELNPEAADGTEAAAGILYADVDASTADTAGVGVVRDAEVNGDELLWPDYIDDEVDGSELATAIAELKALGIIVR